MTSSRDNPPHMTPEERDFVERLAEQYSPPPMTASERVTFDEALQSRLSRRRSWRFKPLAVAGMVAALALMFVLFNRMEPDLTGQKETVPQAVRETPDQRRAVGDVLLALAFDEPDGFDTEEWLPEDYVAISSFVIDQE
jgi:hypothetical protein